MIRPARRTRVVLADAARRPPIDADRRRWTEAVGTGRTVGTGHMVGTGRTDLAELTPVGDALVHGLVRAQLALAVRMALVVLAGLGTLPLLFVLAPTFAAVTVLGVSLPWLLLGVVAFPFLVVVGWAYVRLAERNERDFAAVVDR